MEMVKIDFESYMYGKSQVSCFTLISFLLIDSELCCFGWLFHIYPTFFKNNSYVLIENFSGGLTSHSFNIRELTFYYYIRSPNIKFNNRESCSNGKLVAMNIDYLRLRVVSNYLIPVASRFFMKKKISQIK